MLNFNKCEREGGPHRPKTSWIGEHSLRQSVKHEVAAQATTRILWTPWVKNENVGLAMPQGNVFQTAGWDLSVDGKYNLGDPD